MELLLENISENQINRVVDAILSVTPLPNIITLEGDLGAGKTTLVKALISALGSDDQISSPTFSLVNEYHLQDGSIVLHSDWYRLKSQEELFDSGIVEYIDSGARMIIEWPQIGEDLLKGIPQLNIRITHLDEGRTYSLSTQ